MNLVVGSTGLMGREICRHLTAAGKPVRALVRATSDQAKVDALSGYGAEIRVGDVRERASLDAACHGAKSVFAALSAAPFAYQPGGNDIQAVDYEGHISLIDAAKAAGVQHFVYLSFSRHLDLSSPLADAKRGVEAYLEASGLTYTILQPTLTMERWISPVIGFDAANAKAQIYGSGKNAISWISAGDVAQFAVASLENPAAQNAKLMIGGPEALSPLEVVHIFEQTGGRPFDLQFVPEGALAAQQAGATDPLEQSFPAILRCLARGDVIDMEELLKVFPITLGTVQEYAQRVLGVP